MKYSCLCFFILFTFTGITPGRSQDLSGLSLCVDPGHGQGNANQGPTGLREADINLSISLFLKEFLKSANIDTVLLTRVDDSTNPTLSQREALANGFGVDWFHSVHHNACGAVGVVCGSRSTIVLIEEERTSANPCPDGSARGTGQPEWPDLSNVMSDLMGNRIFQALRTTSTRTWLDWTFYGGCNGGFSLGVLNDLLMPGELSEATFHQNLVEENKLRNADFLKLEARALFMAILDFYDAGQLTTGELAGIITSQQTGQPINGAQVILQPGDVTYTTDGNNNGLYVFHDLPPGAYTVSVSANNFESKQQTVAVQAHAFNFADFSLSSALAPTVVNTLPTNAASNYDVYSEIGVRFSRPMNRQSVENAFIIGPTVQGHFIWSNDNLVVLFEPDTRFEFSTDYTVIIKGAAVDTAGRALDGNGDGVGGDDFVFNFITAELDPAKPVVLDFFPVQRDTAIFPRDVFWVTFDKDLEPASVNENSVRLADNLGARVDLQIDYVQRSRSITFIPRKPLLPGQSYSATLTRDIRLPTGEPLAKNFIWQFNTQFQGIAIDFLDDFENNFLWADPDNSPFTQNTVADSTQFVPTPQRFVSGTHGAKLKYEFSATTGFLQIDRLAPTIIPVNDTVEVGVYIFGDGSRNEIRLLVQDSDGAEALPWTIINWAGWRLLRFHLGETPITPGVNGNGLLDGAEIELAGLQFNLAGETKGQVFFDDFTLISPQPPVAVEPPDSDEPNQPGDFVLQQNYPNPFNPQTVIRYRIPGTSAVRLRVILKIYNLQGQTIRTLVETEQQPGVYEVTWDGKNHLGETVSSGLYLYQITLGGYQENKKMIFLK